MNKSFAKKILFAHSPNSEQGVQECNGADSATGCNEAQSELLASGPKWLF